MYPNPKSIYTATQDQLQLQGMQYFPETRSDICVIMVHGMAGNYLDYKFGDVLGQTCTDQGYNYIFSHNRGWGLVNDMVTTHKNKDGGYNMVRCGAVYERFTDCIKDIDAWKQYALAQGHQKLILIGHSLGSPKLIYYLSQTGTDHIAGIVLASPADMVGLAKKDEGDGYPAMVDEAKANIKANNPDKVLSKPLGGWVALSSQTFLDESIPGSPADVLPIARKPATFPELASINIPIFTLFADHDSATINTPQTDLDILKAKAIKCPQFDQAIITNTDHCYVDEEQQLSQTIINWIKKII